MKWEIVAGAVLLILVVGYSGVKWAASKFEKIRKKRKYDQESLREIEEIRKRNGRQSYEEHMGR